MISGVHFNPDAPIQRMENAQGAKSSLFGRINLNWDKVILFLNSALILSGIAFAFFIKLPFIGLGLGVYGVTYVVLYGLAKKAHPASDELIRVQKERDTAQQALDTAEQALALESEQNKSLKDKIKENITGQDASKKLQDEINARKQEKADLEKRVKGLKAERDTYSTSVKKLREEKSILRKQYNSIKDALEKLTRMKQEDPQVQAGLRKIRQTIEGK